MRDCRLGQDLSHVGEEEMSGQASIPRFLLSDLAELNLMYRKEDLQDANIEDLIQCKSEYIL